MESGDCIKKEEMDTDEESDWFGYASNSGEIFFYYNIKTGEHRWPTNSSCSGKTIIKVRNSNVPPKPNKLCSVATQTEDYGCVNHCTSVYVDNEQQMEKRECDSNEIKQELSNDDTVDGQEQNMLNNVDEKLDGVSEDFEVDESLSSIVTEIKRRNKIIQNVSPQRDASCSYCRRNFKSKSHLACHVRTHTGEMPFVSSYFDKAFKQKGDLKVHLRTHTSEKPFKCSHCIKAFTDKRNLIVHLRTHTGEKPYKCSYCDKAFTDKSNLNVHLRVHTGKKPYECYYCNKPFTRKGDLDVHLRIHTGEKPFECSFCDKAFSTKAKRNTHLRTHTNERPYGCSYCNKAFKQKSNLNIHVRTHTGENPFECSYCNKVFAHKSNLKVHLGTHTSGKQ